MRRSTFAGDERSAEKAILEYVLRPDYRPMSMRDLLRCLNAPPDARPLLRRLVQGLMREGRIVRSPGNRLAAAGIKTAVQGRLRVRRDGWGAVSPDGKGNEVSIRPSNLGGAFHGDTVGVRITGSRRGGDVEGVVVGVVARRSRRVPGVFRAQGRGGVVDPLERAWGFPVHIPGSFRMGARDSDVVLAQVLRVPRPGRPAEGRVLDILGALDDPGVDVQAVALVHDLRQEFPEEALEEARALPAKIPAAEVRRRERFDDPAPVTVDGETARDFDDAIAVAPLPGGGFRLSVHIADVAHFVRVEGALDREARERGTSVYFPERVLPMFPERLSNDLCSLRPGEDRLVQSVVLDLDRRGEIAAVRFADGVIRSAARLTYQQVERVLEGKRVQGVPRAVVEMLGRADRLREILEARRHARGSVDFDLPEPRILLDVEGVMTGITIETRNRAHRFIEEFMLVANEAVAAHLQARDAPCLYRIHERPDSVKIDALATFAKGFGLELRIRAGGVLPEDIQSLLDAAEGRPEYPIVVQVALRSMKQARYCATNEAHFGLASPVYCHFTSPIRRYPDLMVHRLLRASRHGRDERLQRLGRGLEPLADACSRLEREAEAAERELLEWKKIAFVKDRVGENFEGIVTGVTHFGLFVQLTDNLVEGLVHVERLSDDHYVFHESGMELRGVRGGRAFRLGDRLEVTLDRVDPVLRRVDLSPANGQGARPTRRRESRGREKSPRRREPAVRRGARRGRKR